MVSAMTAWYVQRDGRLTQDMDEMKYSARQASGILQMCSFSLRYSLSSSVSSPARSRGRFLLFVVDNQSVVRSMISTMTGMNCSARRASDTIWSVKIVLCATGVRNSKMLLICYPTKSRGITTLQSAWSKNGVTSLEKYSTRSTTTCRIKFVQAIQRSN